MAQSVKAIITSSVLEWARRKSGYSLEDVAKKLQTVPEGVKKWESGEEQPTIAQLRRVGTILKRPLAFFLLPEPPKDFDAIKDFRRIPGKEPEPESPALLLAIRNAHERRTIALELLENLGETAQTNITSGTLAQEPEALANMIRSSLGLTYQIQRSWTSFYEAFNYLKDNLERIGILVFQFGGVDRTEARGFSLGDFPLPVVAINRTELPQARIFSLFHEFAHLILRQSGLCDFVEIGRTPEEQRVEVFCNHVAGAAILPRENLLAEPEVNNHLAGTEVEEAIIRRLSNKYRCSREVVLRRLLLFGLINQSFYETKREEYHLEFEKTSQQSSGFAPPHLLALSSNGKFFTVLALRSYHEHRISASTLSDYLGVRLKHIPNIEHSVSLGGEV